MSSSSPRLQASTTNLLDVVFAPAMPVLSRLRLSGKVVLITAALLAPMAALLVNAVNSANEGLATLRSEETGMRVVASAKNLNSELLRHRGQRSQVLGGNKDIEPERLKTRQRITEISSKIEADALGLNLGKTWTSVRTQIDQVTGETPGIHAHPGEFSDPFPDPIGGRSDHHLRAEPAEKLRGGESDSARASGPGYQRNPSAQIEPGVGRVDGQGLGGTAGSPRS